MKAAKLTTAKFPRPARFSLYICAVLVLCFFNWVALNAQTARNHNAEFVITLAEESEPEIQLQDWMMDFENGYLAEMDEPELKVEPWMLTFTPDYIAGTDESEICFEPWMVNFEQRCLVVDNEKDVSVECWMVCTSTWECATYLLALK